MEISVIAAIRSTAIFLIPYLWRHFFATVCNLSNYFFSFISKRVSIIPAQHSMTFSVFIVIRYHIKWRMSKMLMRSLWEKIKSYHYIFQHINLSIYSYRMRDDRMYYPFTLHPRSYVVIDQCAHLSAWCILRLKPFSGMNCCLLFISHSFH